MYESCLCLAGAKIKLDGDHCRISSILATKGLLWLGTSLGITLVYRIPCLEGLPLITGRPYLAYAAHQDSVHVLLSMSMRLISSTVIIKDNHDAATLQSYHQSNDISSTAAHPDHHSVGTPARDESTTPQDDTVQLVITAGKGLTHFYKPRTLTMQIPHTIRETSQGGYLIVYELDSTLHLFDN